MSGCGCIVEKVFPYETLYSCPVHLSRQEQSGNGFQARIGNRVFALEARVAALDEWSDHFGLAERLTATPPAPEERCAKCLACYWKASQLDEPARCHIKNCGCHTTLTPAAASAAPSGREDTSPEQAQETCGFPGCISPQAKPGWGPHNKGANGFPKGPHASHHQWTPPEQARRTWGNVDQVRQTGDRYCDRIPTNIHPPITVTELRPGERIVSGEGVRYHKHGSGLYECKDEPGVCQVAEFHLTAYPDAPPRAEGE